MTGQLADNLRCDLCGGTPSNTSMYCPMSEGGEGEHEWSELETITTAQAAFILRQGEHEEKSGAER